jgi:hypothetical protein
MLSFLKKIFGSTVPAEPAPAPYKVETPATKVAEFPFPSVKPDEAKKKPAVKKPAAKKTSRKPKTPKA